MEKIKKSIIVLCICAIIAVLAILVTVLISQSASDEKIPSNDSSDYVEEISSDDENESLVESQIDEGESNTSNLDATFGNLLLVNADNPLPETYDSEIKEYLVEIDPQYRNNDNVTKIHKDVYRYITAMVAAAQEDGVNLKVWSPFRSYATQKVLFKNRVQKEGGDEAKAASAVARPGTSEHNTGLCADFNMAKAAFADTEMYAWMVENAEDYGFVMRYREDKQPITGVMHETWHWRFVGINNAKEMNRLDMCLEEYVEYLKTQE